MAEMPSEIIALRKSVLSEVGRFFNLRTLKPHEAMDLECRIDDVIVADIQKAAIKKAKSILEDELDMKLSVVDKAFEEVEAAESALEDAEFSHEDAVGDVRKVERSIRKVEVMAKSK